MKLKRAIHTDARFWLTVAAISLATAMVRFAIADYSLWFDEQASMFFSRQPLTRLWSGWMLREPNPPLYYSALKCWIAAFGDTARAARGLSIAAGAAGIATTALFTRRMYGRSAGVIAAVLSAVSAQQLYYSLQVRPYECVYLAASGVMISLLAIERALRQDRAGSAGLLIYASCCTVCIYLHTTMVLLPVIASLALVIVRRRDILARPALVLPLAVANLGVALAAGWWLDITARQIVAGAENVSVFDAVTPWLVVGKTIGTLSFARETGVARTAIAVLTTAIVMVQVLRSWSNPATRLLVTVLGLAITVFALISLGTPIFLPRTLFWLSSIATALCAGGLAAVRDRRVRWAATLGLGSLVALNMATAVRSRQTEDWTGAIAAAARTPGARLIVQGEAMGLLLSSACDRLQRGRCAVPIIAVTSPDDRLDGWAAGLYAGPKIGMERIAMLPSGHYWVFRKAFYHDLIATLHRHGHAHAIRRDPVLLGPIERATLVR